MRRKNPNNMPVLVPPGTYALGRALHLEGNE